MTEETKTAAPHDMDAERAVLGSILHSDRAFFRVDPILRAEDFFREGHRILFEAMAKMSRRGEQPDTLTLKAALGEESLQRAGGSAYVSSLMDFIPDVSHVENYARIVARESKRRRIIRAANEAMQRAIGNDEEPEIIAAEAVGQLAPQATNESAQARRFGEIVTDAYKAAELRRTDDVSLALRTGLAGLDAYQAIRRYLIVVGSPSKHGKSALAKDLAVGLAKHGHPVAMFTLESTPEDIAWRHISAESGIPHGKVQDWRLLNDSDFAKLAAVEGAAQRLPIYVTRSVRTIAQIEAEVRRLKALQFIDAVIVDYIQLIRHPGGPRDREERTAEIARLLLELSLELETAIIVTSQVNKERLTRDGGRLYPSDLKYAAAIGESARCVLLFHRPHVDDPNERACKVLFQVAAQNEGRTGDYEMHFAEVTQKFADGSCAENGCARAVSSQRDRSMFSEQGR